MPNLVRTHVMTGGSGEDLTPRTLTKQEFGRRLYKLMMSRGWNQSELARRAGLNRDAISTYVRGSSMPTPQSLNALAKAFGITPDDLLPNYTMSAIERDNPAFEMKASTSDPTRVYLKVNRLVTMATAVKIAELLQNDESTDRD